MQQTATPLSYAQTIGVRAVEETADLVAADLEFRTDLQQGTGVFHAGAIMALAHTAAARCAALNAPAGDSMEGPRLVQLTSNLYRNAGAGSTIRAEARPVQRGRTLIVIETTVSDHAARQLGVITTTYLVVPPAPAG